MYFYGYFQIDVLINLMNLFIALKWAEAITWGNFILAKQNPGSTKEGSCLARMKLFACNCRM